MQFIGIHISLVDSEDAENTVEDAEIFTVGEATLPDIAAQLSKAAENLANSGYTVGGKWVLLNITTKQFSKATERSTP